METSLAKVGSSVGCPAILCNCSAYNNPLHHLLSSLCNSKTERKMKEITVEIQDFDKREEEEETLSPKGAIFRHNRFDSYILIIVGLSKTIHLPSLKTMLHNTVLKHRRFCSVVKRGRRGSQKWVVQKEVEVENHIVVPQLCGSSEDANFVENYTASLATAPAMDPSRPLWEVHVLNCKSDSVGAEASLVFRVHHCIGDCISLTSLFLDSTTKSSEPQSKPTVPSVATPGQTKFSFCGIFLWVWSGIFCFLCTLYELIHALFTLLWMKDVKCLRGGPDVVNHKKALGHVTVDLKDISLVRKAVGGTVNDVVTGMLSASFSKHFQRMADVNQKSKLHANVPSNPRIRALVPVNLRSPPAFLRELEHMLKSKGSSGGWGNGFGLWILPIKAVKRESYLKYCHVGRAFLGRKKASIEARFTFLFTALIARLFGLNWGMYLPYRTCLNTALTFSNVQGPIEQVRLMDSTVTAIITTVSRVPQGLVVHFQSYAGKAKVVALASENIALDPQQFCKDCAESLQQMKEESLKSLKSSNPVKL